MESEHIGTRTMVDEKDSEAVLLLTILQEPIADKARRAYLKAFGVNELDDQAIYDLIEERVFNAILLKEPVIEIERELAQRMLLLLKGGMKRKRGGQPSTRHQALRKRVLVGLALRIKAELVKGGMDATQAHLQAAEEAAEEVNQHGLNYTANYLAREMDKAGH